MRVAKAGLIYFLLLFAVGWILGPIRELWAVPLFGRTAAMASEAAIMMITMVAAARWVIRRFEVPRTLSATIVMGFVALGLLIPAEIAGVVSVRGLSLKGYFASFPTARGVISLLMFLLFAVMPSLVARISAAGLERADCGEEDRWKIERWDAGHPYRYRV